jgi:hypothetical protein
MKKADIKKGRYYKLRSGNIIKILKVIDKNQLIVKAEYTAINSNSAKVNLNRFCLKHVTIEYVTPLWAVLNAD